jgi:hypothetical protein
VRNAILWNTFLIERRATALTVEAYTVIDKTIGPRKAVNERHRANDQKWTQQRLEFNLMME